MLDFAQVARLKRHGFLEQEISEWNWGTTPDGYPQVINLDDALWQAAMSSRKAWVDRMRGADVPDDEIRGAIMGWHRKSMWRTVWDFLRAEYNQAVAGRRLTDYEKARQKRSEAKVSKLYGGKPYG